MPPSVAIGGHRRTTGWTTAADTVLENGNGMTGRVVIRVVRRRRITTMTNHRPPLRLRFGFCIAATALAFAGCDGYIQMTGRVYTQSRSNDRSCVYTDQIPDANLSQLVPVPNATVTLYFGDDYATKPVDRSDPMKRTQETDADGRFQLGSTCAPSEFHAALVVEKLGYGAVTETFRHKGGKHRAIVILTPDAPSGLQQEEN